MGDSPWLGSPRLGLCQALTAAGRSTFLETGLMVRWRLGGRWSG